jgi:8-oxo-dGTP diphosphatase
VYSVCSVGTISSSSSSSEPVSPADRAPVPVVCAVLEDTAGRILIAQRPAHKHLGLLWEFPGGKVDPGETPAAALHRELTEELGCTVTITRTLEPFLHDYTRVIIEMFPFVCHLAPGSPAPAALEHLALRWVTPRELSSFDLAPADWPVVARYRANPDPCCAH